MNSYRKTAIIVGALFLIAMAAAFLGPTVNVPDYLTSLSANSTRVIIGSLIELIGIAAAVVAIAFMMFPILKKHNEALALGYVGLRILEAVIVVVGAFSALLLSSLSQAFVKAGAPDAPYYQTLGTLLLAARDWTFLMTGIFFGLGALVFYYLLYQSKLIPRFISVWGFIAAILILAVNLPNMFGYIVPTTLGLLLALPIISNEIFLAIWLIVKGFNPSAIEVGSA